jgi:3-methylcrotonyl-CoA carboxylase beta subunit
VKLDQMRRSGGGMSEQEKAEFMRPTLQKYEAESSCYYSSARLWDDGVLDPVETRNALALGIAASLNAPIPAGGNFGVFRM